MRIGWDLGLSRSQRFYLFLILGIILLGIAIILRNDSEYWLIFGIGGTLSLLLALLSWAHGTVPPEEPGRSSHAPPGPMTQKERDLAHRRSDLSGEG